MVLKMLLIQVNIKNNQIGGKIIKLIVVIALADMMCGIVYVLSNNKKINLPKMGEVEEVLIKKKIELLNHLLKKMQEKILKKVYQRVVFEVK